MTETITDIESRKLQKQSCDRNLYVNKHVNKITIYLITTLQ